VQDALHQFDSEGVVSKNTASEYCLASLVASVEWILSNSVPAKLVLPVHDSLLFEVREDAVELVESVIPGIMTGWPCTGPGGDVKLVVDKKYGTSWGSLQKAK
jgi:DNA polymerase I-like protein with 3'-5' exonuclease and polymerase domains